MRSDQVPTDPDVDLRVARQRAELRRGTGTLLAAIAAGGMIGATVRYGLTLIWPHQPDAFPLATFVTNVSGCFLIGVLMVLITEAWAAPRLMRPFLGVGVLGGYTTFSTYAVEVQQAVATGHARTGLLYLAGTLAAALVAVYTGIILTRRLATGLHPRRKGDR